MIQANELRIGNWVQTESEKYKQVENIFGDRFNLSFIHGETFSDPLTEVDGIPTTPEILEKAGFKHYNLSSAGKTRKQWKIVPNDSFYLYGTDFYYAPNVIPEIKYLHQLQNLYFALTGEELNINL